MIKASLILSGMLIILLISFNTIKAQNLVTIYDTIDSEILKEKRLIEVLLPENYKQNPEERYDVIYVTDGEWNIKVVSQIYDYLAYWGLVPKNIIVSIPHNNLQGINEREKDFIARHDGQPVSGRADNFISFLKSELIPYINKTYSTTGEKTLYGQSLGGSFALYTLLTEPPLFDSYIAADPALWYDNYYINRLASVSLNNISGNKALFMSGRGLREGFDYRSMGVFSMDSVINARNPEGLHWKSIAYLDETHRTIHFKTIYDGLRFIYDGYAAKIRFNPNNGIVLKNKPIKITPEDETYYFNIRYTTDGSEPTETSARFEGINITEPTNLKIKLFSANGRYDQVASGNFESGNVFPALSAPKNIKPGGLHYAYYKGEWSDLPELKKLNPDSSGFIKEAYGILKLPNQSKGACLIEGYLEIKEDGYYNFMLDTDDIAKLYINEKLLIAYNGLDHKMELQTYILPLEKGFYPLRLEYFIKRGGRDLSFGYNQQGKLQTLPVPIEYLYFDGKYSAK